MNKSPIAKFQNFMGQIDSRTTLFWNPLFILFLLGTEEPACKKKKKTTPIASARPYHLTKCKPECRPNGPL
jgi:hypothetical protein